MARQRYVWRGRRRQKLRALQRILVRIGNKLDPHFKQQYQLFPYKDIGSNFFTFGLRCATLLSLKETIPEAPAVTP